MPVYISMLRGVNVGPHNRMKMEPLRRSLECLGFEKIQTYIQSGNIVFTAAKQQLPAVSAKIRIRIFDDFGYDIPVVTVSAEQMEKTIRDNPFLKRRGIDESKLHVTFLSQPPAAPPLKKVAMSAGSDEFAHLGEAVYLHCPNGYGETKLTNHLFEKLLAVNTSTTRNWKTVKALYEMALACT